MAVRTLKRHPHHGPPWLGLTAAFLLGAVAATTYLYFSCIAPVSIAEASCRRLLYHLIFGDGQAAAIFSVLLGFAGAWGLAGLGLLVITAAGGVTAVLFYLGWRYTRT